MQWVQHNWVWKIISLLLAFSLWAYVRDYEATERREFNVPVEIPVQPGQVLVEPVVLPLVRVTVDGPAGRLKELDPDQVKPIIRMAGYRHGETQRLRVEVPSIPEDLQVYCLPAFVEVRTEARIERSFQLVIDSEGALPEGWDWVQPAKADATEVTVSGLQSTVDRIARVVAPLPALNPQEQVRVSVNPKPLDKSGRDIDESVTLTPAQVIVQARLTRTVWSKQVYVQPVFSTPAGTRLRVTVDPRRVMIYGTARALQELHFIETPDLDIPASQPRFVREIRLELSPGIIRIEPGTVRITIEQLAPSERP